MSKNTIRHSTALFLSVVIPASCNQADNIGNTRSIEAMYKTGKQISKGPLAP